jgi:hypothetical protein
VGLKLTPNILAYVAQGVFAPTTSLKQDAGSTPPLKSGVLSRFKGFQTPSPPAASAGQAQPFSHKYERGKTFVLELMNK